MAKKEVNSRRMSTLIREGDKLDLELFGNQRGPGSEAEFKKKKRREETRFENAALIPRHMVGGGASNDFVPVEKSRIPVTSSADKSSPN